MRRLVLVLLLVSCSLTAPAAPPVPKWSPPKWVLRDAHFLGERWYPATMRDCDAIKKGAIMVINYSVGIEWPWRSFCYWGKPNVAT